MESRQDDTRELSLSEWCDRRFTNMYSHSEFASAHHKSRGRSPSKAHCQTASAKQVGSNADTLWVKAHRRATQSAPRSCSEDKKSRTARQSASPERWPKVSPRVPQRDTKLPSVRCCDKMKRLSVSDGAGGCSVDTAHTDGPQPEKNTCSSPMNQVTKTQKIKGTLEDGPSEMKAKKNRAHRVSVDSLSSGQESHASKRTFSELSPGRKQTKSKKGKKRLRGLEISPKKTEKVQQQAVGSPDLSSDDWESTKLSSSGDRTRVTTVEDIQNKATDHSKTQEAPCAANKERSRTKPEQNTIVETLSVKHTTKDSCSSGNVKIQIKSKIVFSQNSHADGQNKHDSSVKARQDLVVTGSKLSRKDSAAAKVEETLGKDDSRLAGNCLHLSSSRGQVVALREFQDDANEEGQRPEYAKDNPTEDVTIAQVKHRKDSRKLRGKSLDKERVGRVPSGEYDVESSVDSEGTKFEIPTATACKAVVDDGPEMSSKGEKITKHCRVVRNGITSTSAPVERSCNWLPKGSGSAGKSLETATISEQRRRNEDCVSNTKDRQSKCQMDKQILTPATSHRGSLVTEGSSVNSFPQAKGAGTAKVQDDKTVTEDGRADCKPPSAKCRSSVGASFFTKRVLNSVLKPLASSRSAAKLRPRSAESATTNRRIEHSGHMQRKPSWPTSKVQLEHICQAFASGSDEEGETAEPVVDKKSGSELLKESRQENPGISDRRQSTKFDPLHRPTQYQAENHRKPQPECPDGLADKEGGNEKMECCPNSPQLPGVKLDPASANSEGFTSQLVPRSVSRNQGKKSPSEDQSKLASPGVDGKNLEEVAEASVLEKTMAKNDYIADWLDKHYQPQTESSKVSGRQHLEPGELPDDDSSSDEAWEQFVDSIMKRNNEEFFCSPYCKRVQQKRRTTGLGPVASSKSSSFPVTLAFKPQPTSQNNVAAVPPYCVRRPTPPMTSAACTWSGPMPDFLEETHSLNPSAPQFRPRNANQTSPDVNHSTNASQRMQANASALERAPGDYPGNGDFRPTTKSVLNVPTRSLRLDQRRTDKGRPVSSCLPSSPGCVYSKGVCRESLVSTSVTSSTPQSSTSSLSAVTSNASPRSWTSRSLGWSSSLTRTPGTITPTRFTAWTDEVSAPSPWRMHHAPNDTAVELGPRVDYPVCSVPYIDTHCHIDFLFQRSEYRGTFEKFSKIHNFPPNYAGCLAVFCTPEGFEPGALWKDLVMEKNIWMAFGCHPHHAKSYDGIVEDNIIKRMRHPKAIALGEIGLDYSNRCTSDRPLQIEVFRRQLQIALQLGKPLVIHSRNAEHDTLGIMKQVVPINYKIHRHCFTGSPQEARNFLQAFPNSFIGLTALVTFPTAYPVHRTATEIPLSKILLETDAPYFLPKQCPRVLRWANPSMAVFVAARIAQLRGIALDEVLYAVRRNTTEMYGI